MNPENFFPLPVEVVMVDLDGTLLHTAPDLAEAANRMLSELNMTQIEDALVKTYIGNGVTRLIKRVLTRDMDGEPAADLLSKAKRVYEKHYGEVVSLNSRPFPQVLEGLQVFKDTGYRLGCITNKAEKFTLPLLRDTGLYNFFELILSGDSLPKMKPDPLPLNYACKHFSVPQDKMLLIGDSLNDTQAARAAGCHVFCVPYGYNRGGDVHDLDTDAVIDSLLTASKLICRA